MASSIDIINSALSQLGEAPITALTDVSRAARLADRTYDDLRQGLLRDHPWNFAMRRASLAASATAPNWEFTYAYPVPSDFLRLVEVYNPNRYEVRVETTTDGTVFATDLSAPLQIKYTSDVTNAAVMDPKFREALAGRLAVEWAEPLTGTAAKVNQSAQLYVQKLRDARAIDGQEDTAEIISSDEWLDARY